MDARRGEAEQHIAGRYVAARQDAVALDRAHCEPGEVVVAAGIDAGHFGGLAADEGGARLAATIGDPGDHRGGDRRVELAGGEIVEEEQGLGALDDEVVHAHRDEVDSDRIVPPGLDGELHLGADAVGRGNEHRVLEARGLQVEEAGEPADQGFRARSPRTPDDRRDQVDEAVAGVDVHSGVRVTRWCLGLPFRHSVEVPIRDAWSAPPWGFAPASVCHDPRMLYLTRETRPTEIAP